MWNPKTDACDYCVECEYFLDWKCLGLEPCLELVPKKDSKYKKVELLVSNEEKINGKNCTFYN